MKLMFSLVTVLFGGFTVWAGEPTDQIRQTTNDILTVVKEHRGDDEATVEKRRSRIREIVNTRFDWRSMAQRSLGRHWRGKTDEQRSEFIDVFSRLLEDTYRQKVEGYGGEEVVYENERRDDPYARVFVAIITESGDEISVEYRVKKNDSDQWLVYDVVIEGVSMVKNYRSQFDSLLARGSFEDMLDKVREKVEE